VKFVFTAHRNNVKTWVNTFSRQYPGCLKVKNLFTFGIRFLRYPYFL